MNFNIGWHVLYVKSRWEKKVYESLKEISLESFLPQIKTVRQWSDRKKLVLMPLFPSYVFVNINTSLEFHKATSVYGACAFIRFGKDYAVVPEKEINQIKLLVGDSNIMDIEVDAQKLKVGEKKKIMYAPLNGMECEILNINNINKIVVRIESLQQCITAVVPPYYFESLEPSLH
ncbi:UpxY family transcription antiterminator [Kordia sp. YSTF-M3]|uniref:UpxY family transcription antiterminator n=1 Tax=Kordia aestuariivivens TaxID=2759037 RepID=A0ABR7QGS3_9FLAO|nr:UpxY family transcription antiterminator [Kordia aestuariivivens]MBC8757698.1 UpxY family transcription antiterminator [Kordia aestuariivivens]